jgi:hypothetical protein
MADGLIDVTSDTGPTGAAGCAIDSRIRVDVGSFCGSAPRTPHVSRRFNDRSVNDRSVNDRSVIDTVAAEEDRCLRQTW